MTKPLTLVLLTTAFLFAAELRAAAPAVPVNDAPIMLSPYEVAANTVEFERWVKLSSPHYILYTDAREKTATQAIRHLEMLREVEDNYFAHAAVKANPIVVILPTSESDWKRIASKGRVQWQVGVSGAGHRAQTIIIAEYDWEEKGFSTLLSSIANAELINLNISGPLWFRYGVGNFFATATYDDDSLTVGYMNSAVAYFQRGTWLDWPTFFKVNQNSAEFTQKSLIDRYDAQTAVFAQYLLTHKDLGWIDRLLRWSAIMEAGAPPTEEAFKAVMGQDWKSWQETMEHHLRNGEYQTRTYKLATAVTHMPVRKEVPRTREMRDLFVLTQILNQDIPASVTALDAVLAAGLATKSLQELLLEACLVRGRPEKAEAIAHELIANGSTNPGVFTISAYQVYYRQRGKNADRSLSAEDSAQVETWCRRALEIEPRQLEANEILADVLSRAPQVGPESIAEIKRLYENVRGTTGTSRVVTALATAYWRSGNAKAARPIVDSILKSPYTRAADRKTARWLLDAMQNNPPAPAAPAGPAK